MKKEDVKKINAKIEKNELTYEDFTKTAKNIFKDWSKDISKEDFNKIQEYSKKVVEYENKIDELALNYIIDVPNKQLHGYYTILEYCLKKIKENDVKYNQGLGFGSTGK